MKSSLSSLNSFNGNSTSTVSKSSFFFGMRILPKVQREAMYLIYAFCRSVDDIADSDYRKDRRLEGLNQWRLQIHDLYKKQYEGNLTKGLLRVIQSFELKEEDFQSVIEGMEMDVKNIHKILNWKSLDKYCDCVASSVGRLSTKIFGIEEKSGVELSYHLGRALQLTNILRDIDEDAQMGRIYLPEEELLNQNIHFTNIEEIISHHSFAKVCVSIAERSVFHFVEAERIMSSLPRTLVKSPRIMCSVYRALLNKLLMRGWKAPRIRVSAPKGYVILSLIKYGII